MSHEFDLFGPVMKTNRVMMRAFLDCFFNHGYELWSEMEWGPFKWKGPDRMRGQVDFGRRPIETLLDAMESGEHRVCFQMVENKWDYAWFYYHPTGEYKFPTGKTRLAYYHIMTDNFLALLHNPGTVTQWSLKVRFQRILSVMKSLALITKSFYGNTHIEDPNWKYFKEFVRPMRARFPFKLTFWGSEYPTRPDESAKSQLREIGYIVEDTEAGVWLYYPVEHWYSKEYERALRNAIKVLKPDDKES